MGHPAALLRAEQGINLIDSWEMGVCADAGVCVCVCVNTQCQYDSGDL